MSPPALQLLERWRGGDEESCRELIPIVYTELRKLAHDALRGESSGHTLSTTALVNEAFLRLLGSGVKVGDQVHLLALASRLMRRILIDHARAGGSEKRGAGAPHIPMEDYLGGRAEPVVDMRAPATEARQGKAA
ncbi:MAG: ECF-type sigma factor [Bryobacteraceae bacterium]